MSVPFIRIECFGATRPQAGRAANEDAFVIESEPIFHSAIFDGAGNAEQAARKAARFFRSLIKDQSVKAGDPAAWEAWVRLMDSHLLGANQSTFVGLSVPDPRATRVAGAHAGNSRAYCIGADGVKIVSHEPSPRRLGSGQATAKTWTLELGPYDILLLMSDGAWAPFGSTYLLRKAAWSALAKHFSEVPQAVLDAATSPDGPADDMTVIALRIRGRPHL
jgi:serine/threonine protein phosphatase PrpC